MITFDLSMNIFTLLAIMSLCVFMGTLGRIRQLTRKDRRIAELEREMIQAHAELLDMQKDHYELVVKMKLLEGKDPSIPVINIKKVPKEQETQTEPKPANERSSDRSNRTA
jgi:hypothetical protein